MSDDQLAFPEAPDPAESHRRAMAGMQQAYDNAYEEWKAESRWTLEQLAASGREFTSEDVTLLTAERGYVTAENRALGGIISAGVKSGLIVHAGWTRAKRPELHSCPKRLYRGANHVPVDRCPTCGR